MNKTGILAALLLFSYGISFSLAQERIILGDERMELYLPLLQGKRVALFSNHTGLAGDKHVLDVLVERGINVTVLFSPEHGFRGTAEAGERVTNDTDSRTGIPILSLYDGKEKRPSEASMRKFDILVVDIQDVGTRFYTYYITMCRLMDACAEFDREVVILDRPNPNGHYVEGPLLDMKRYKSGVGWLPIPVVHGMTLGELARMVNGEKWLPQARICKLTVIPCLNYTHQTPYRLPVPPSPNLPNMKAVYLYPSLCFFEGTPISMGRGTELPFQLYGHPDLKHYSYCFRPRSLAAAKHPPHEGKLCYGVDLSGLSEQELRQKGLDLSHVIEAYRMLNIGSSFFRPFFNLLAGTDSVRQMIEAGYSAEELREAWRPDVERFKEQRKPYLLYPE